MKNSLFIMVSFLFSMKVFSWTVPINISNTPTKSNEPAIVVDTYNRVHVTWEDFQTHPDRIPSEILYRYFDGDTWSNMLNVSRDSTESWTSRIAVDRVGYPHVIWEDWGTGWSRSKIYYSYFDSDSFTTPICLSDTLHTGHPFARVGAIVCDSMDRVHVVWCAEIGGYLDIYYTRYNGYSWSSPVNVSNSLGYSGFSDMALDLSNDLHVVWKQDTPSQHLDSVDIYYSRFHGDSWSTPVNASNLLGESRNPHISVSPDGYPHLVWGEGYHIYYSFYNGDVWSTAFPVSDTLTQEKGYRPDILVDIHSYAHIVWGGQGGELWYTYHNSNSWSTPIDVSSSSVNSVFPSITVDYSDRLHLAWVDPESAGSEISDIFYSKHNLTGMEEGNRESTKEEILSFPNPFRFRTTILYTLSEDTRVRLQISDIVGRALVDLDLGYKAKGCHSLSVSAEFFKNGGRSGIYFYTIEAYGEVIARGKLILLH